MNYTMPIVEGTSRGWRGQVALITGGADGLGLAIAQRLAHLGVVVGLMDRDGARLTMALEKFPEVGRLVVPLVADVTDSIGVANATEKLQASHGRIDILVNCAGITGRTAIPFHEVAAEDFERVWRVNVLGCFFTSAAVLPGMLERNYGRILHIASIAGKEGNAGMAAYSSSKAAVIGLTKSQGKDYARTGVTVNALAPAVVETEMVAALPPETVKYMTDKIPMGRCGTLSEVAAMAAFIVSPEASFTTGFTFDLTGGRATY